MPTRRHLLLAASLVPLLLHAPPVRAADPDDAFERTLRPFLQMRCLDCHGQDDPAGKVSLAELGAPSKQNAGTWQRVLGQIATGEMPPDGEPRPDLAARETVMAAIAASLKAAGIEPKFPSGPLPRDGNLVDHERLFSGHFRGPASSPPRFWRTSQPRYDALMERLWVVPKLRYEKAHRRDDPQWAGYGYAQPFPALDPEDFTNYSGEVHADETVLRSLMDAGAQIAERILSDKTAYAPEIQPAVAAGAAGLRRGGPWERFKIAPPPRPAEFDPFAAADASPTAEQRRAAVERTFRLLLSRAPSAAEQTRYQGLLERTIARSGAPAAIRGLIVAVFVSPEFVFRMEIGLGPPDEHGRRMLAPNELVHAVSGALTDDGPDDALWQAAATGRLKTKADVEREVRRLLADDAVEKHRRLRFFQEFFGYHRAVDVFKDDDGWGQEVQYLVRDADLLVEHVLRRDRQVLAELLTTDRYFVAYPNIRDPELLAAVRQRTIDETKEAIEKARQRKQAIEPDRRGRYSRSWSFLQGRTLIPRTVHGDRAGQETSYVRLYGFDLAEFDWTPQQPIAVPGRRAGILTHPAWLVAHSGNFDNDVVGRGHWIRERLLAGRIPDVPIDVDAQVPDEPESTLRHRLRVTQAERCIRCHRRMDPLGLPFEIYDHYGRYREQELVGTRKNRPLPIDPSGAVVASGEPALDGPVEDAINLVRRLAKSPRVRQSFVRHAFRYWMGRNETLDDSPVLIAADEAYVADDGSFDTLLVSLLTSDSFLYRK